MKKIVVSIGQEFILEEKVVKQNLKKIEKFFDLKNKYVEVYLVGDKFMQKNVLSFPAPKDFPRPDIKDHENLGEIYLNPDYIKANREDFIFMLIHGFLHLLGYDHKIREERLEMEKKEKEILNVFKR